MRIFKTILRILMIVIFILSLTFNFLIMGSSYGTLIFKHNDSKMISLASSEYLAFNPEYFFGQKSSNIQIYKETKANDVTTKEVYKFQFDKDFALTTHVIDSNNEERFYKGDYMYTTEGKSPLTLGQNVIFGTLLSEITVLNEALVNDIESTNTKAKIDFSFAPFYFIGIKYTVQDENRTIKFRYDLNGNIRKIEITHNDGRSQSYSISYEDLKINIPNL